MKVRILEWQGISAWRWRLNESGHLESGADELCGICRVPFDGTCPNCKYPGEECPLILGADCSHNFHLHCIIKWLEQDSSRGLCPMCRQIFTPKSIYHNETSEDYNLLKTLIDGHRILREGLQNNSSLFESFRSDNVDM